MNRNSVGMAAAAAAFAILAAGVSAPDAYAGPKEGHVKCVGVNGCKGHSECKTATSECKGHNSCKGEGWVSKKTAAECEAAGGKVA